ncbi:MAG: hypothetical protein ASARMPRED_006377 [Alectoria sarmentosa]|nr:MAG: hypothetical protein ASARMPRED_006377 [Alectoria sarmentosa]
MPSGSLACSPFHVRFGKFSLLRPYEKKVEFKVNDTKQDHSMKLGEGGEAFFVFETFDEIPESLQTSPVISPATSPQSLSEQDVASAPPLQEPEFLDLNTDGINDRRQDIVGRVRPLMSDASRAKSCFGALTPLPTSSGAVSDGVGSSGWSASKNTSSPQIKRAASAELIPTSARPHSETYSDHTQTHARGGEPGLHTGPSLATSAPTERSISPPPLSSNDAFNRAKMLSKKLSISNIPTRVTDNGDLMLDMTGYKSSEDEALRAEVIARKILAEELEGNYDIGALIGADEQGNLWIYSSEEAKEAAGRRIGLRGLAPGAVLSDAASDLGYHSDEDRLSMTSQNSRKHQRTKSDATPTGLVTPPQTPPAEVSSSGDPNRNYAKTLRLTSDQLKALNLKPGENSMSFSVNRATCQAYMYYWKYDVPIVISDIDGTITKSDALGHVLNMIGRDWTHIGVAKLYVDIVANGYNILYLTSRSVGQADTTRSYLNGVSQEGFKLPKGPVIMSPDRTIAALRREIYLRKPEVFKMACLRDILNLFGQERKPFYAGFGNRLTDALSYRSVNIPSTRIFTINSNAEVSLDLLTLNKYKSSYVTMREVVDHFFPTISLLTNSGAEKETDFVFWRDVPEEIDYFSESDTEVEKQKKEERESIRSEDYGSEGLDDDDEEEEEEEELDGMGESYLSRDSIDEREGEDLVSSITESISFDDDGNDSVPDAVEVEIADTDGRLSKAHLHRIIAAEVTRSAAWPAK